MKVSSWVMAGDWNTGEDGKFETPHVHLVWTGVPAERVEEILRIALGRDELEYARFYQGLQAEELAALCKSREANDEKTLGAWLKLFGVVWRTALGELNSEEWLVRVRSVDDLDFALALMMGARGKIPLREKSELSGWRDLFMEVRSMSDKLARAGSLKLEKKTLPAELTPDQLI